MKTKRLHLYTLNMKYVRNLSKVDDNVFSVSPQEHKDNRPFVGIIVICNNKEYCIPLTSPKDKHKNMKNDLDFSKIVDKRGNLIGALNFNNMIPVTKDVIIPINPNPNKSDTPKGKAYKELLNNQLDWCNDNIDLITRKANKLYKFVTLTPEKSRSLVRRCAKFQKLETVLERYIKRLFKNPVYIAISDREKVGDILDKNGIVYDISPKPNPEGNYALKVNAEDSEKVKQLISAPKKNMTMK